MAVKFSAFTTRTGTLDASTRIVGYDDPAGTKTNVEFTLATLVDNVPNIYNSDGTLSANRLVNFNSNTLQLGNQGTDGAGVKIFQDGRIEIAKWSGSLKVSGYGTQLRQNFLRLYSNTTLGATITGFATLAASSNWTDGGTGGNGFSINSRLGVIGVHNDNTSYAFRVQNSDLEDMFSVRNDGAFALGKGANTTESTGIAIGTNASSTAASGIAIGAMTGHVTTAGLRSIAMGGSTRAAGSYSVAIGYNCGNNSTSVNNCVNIGSSAQGDGANSITLSATNAGDVVPSTAKAFGVYMSSNTTPDLEVVGGGESTLNTSLKITGQAYTELHTGATPADPDWNNGNIQEMTLASSDQDFDPSNAKAGATYILKIKQPSSGAAGTINWNAASATVLWPSPGEPTLSTANNAVDIVTLICVVGGASGGTYYANATLNFS